MAFDFPTGPTVGQKYPVTAIAGVPQYTWDGQKWTTISVPIGKQPVYTDGSAPMVGPLTLAGDPTNPTDAADKHYVDGTVSGAVGGGIPSGSVMLFYQASAPVGWTQVTSQNDKALRVVSGTGGTSGGTNPFTTVMAQTTVGNHTLSTGEIPTIGSSGGNNISVYPDPANPGSWYYPISHSTFSNSAMIVGTGPNVPAAGAAAITYTTVMQSGTITITVTTSGTSGLAHNHPITMDIQYCNVIIASKN